ncbi:NAD(P)-binding protein [Bimuria novae-zelandiae CBS 107.79]|uniref:NAD(P)-binding protein n=1 Tax=Bimuria novae-zelandiae CBS 107.79 TaxID=1447943 RepID=A0A6A5VLI7_9PLEO|nr:NAD(P)-binding protein [Bimuria novae-zelandiae CBS 107.79]
MKAVLISEYVTDPGALRPTEVPVPPLHPDRPILVRITHCSPQHADILHAQGKHQNNNPKRGWCHPPFILGYDFAGIVEFVLPNRSIENLQINDRVFGAAIGAFAEYIAVKPETIRKLPEGLSNEAACAMAGQAVSYAAVVHVAKVQPEDVVLVSGASGGLGSVCCMAAKALGARVIALTGDQEKAEMMRRDMDVDSVVLVDDGGKWIDGVLEYTNGVGVDVVLDNTGMVNDAIRCLAYMGRIVVLGFAARKGVMESVKMNKLLLKSATVSGYRFGESGRRSPQTLEAVWEGYLELLRSGQLKPLLYGKYDGLEDMGRALGDLAARKVYGKIVVKVARSQRGAKL